MQLSAIALTAVLVLTGPQPETPTSDPGVIEQCVLTPLYKAKVPAEEQGTVAVLDVIEGQHVRKGDRLAVVDDRLPRMQKEIAEYKLKAAKAEAENKVNYKFAVASHDVAVADLAGMKEANHSTRKTYPETEIRKAELDVTKTNLQIDQAEQDQITARLKANVQQGELDAANLEIERRQILSPLEGEVVERFVQEREWVRAGDPIMTIEALDRLLVKAGVDGTRISRAELIGKRVTVEAHLARGRVERFDGKVRHVSPDWDSHKEFTVWAEVYNRQENDVWLLGGNMSVRMTIHWQEPKAP